MKANVFSIMMLFFHLFPAYGIDPSVRGFEELHEVLKSAVRELDTVQSPDHLSMAMKYFRALVEECGRNPDLVAVLELTSESCPPQLKEAYKAAMELQGKLHDASKRLAMSGMMQNKEEIKPYLEFMQKFTLKKNAKKRTEPQVHEGAPPETEDARDARMKWWRDGKFGMFIHYGLYSGLAGEIQGKKYKGCVEWIMQYSGVDSETYAREALPRFKPKRGKAETWVKLAKEAGCVYTILTSRHHEGFNMFDSKFSDFNVKTTKGVDIVKEYAEACKKYGMKAGYYFSLLDWSHPDYDPTGSGISYPKGNYEAQKQGRRQFGNHEKYKDYLYNIFNELLTSYAPVDLVWWDFSQPGFQGDKAWNATALMKNLFEKNPKAIQNNRLYHSANHLSEGGIRVTPAWKGDYSTAEHHIPATGINGDWEACQTLNGTWGYSADNQEWKTSQALIRELIDTVSRGGNFLLNIGPMPDGSIPPESIRIFKEIGFWMKKNGEAIYGTRANPLNIELTWGRLTRKGEDITYIFVYDKPDNGELTIPCSFEGDVKAVLLGGEKTVNMSQDKKSNTTTFYIKNMKMDTAATVIKVMGKRMIHKRSA